MAVACLLMLLVKIQERQTNNEMGRSCAAALSDEKPDSVTTKQQDSKSDRNSRQGRNFLTRPAYLRVAVRLI